jgi:hypothetical protein
VISCLVELRFIEKLNWEGKQISKNSKIEEKEQKIF